MINFYKRKPVGNFFSGGTSAGLLKKSVTFAFIFLMLASARLSAQSIFPILPGSALADGDDDETLRTWLQGVGVVPRGTLLYKRSTDGFSASAFHSKVDNQGPTLVLFKTNQGTVFGGFSTASWGASYNNYNGNYGSSSQAFLFNLNTNSKGDVYYRESSIFSYPSYGPTFGNGHDIHINESMDAGYFNVYGYNSVDGSEYRSSTSLRALTGIETYGNTSYSFGSGFITEIEVYKIDFNSSAPTINGKDIAVSLNANGTASITTQDIDNGTTDPDGPVTLAIDKSVFDCSNLAGQSNAVPTTFVGTVHQSGTSYGSGYNPNTKEFWYPQWGSSTVYVYNEQGQQTRTFYMGHPYVMQLWADTDDANAYYTANFYEHSITKRSVDGSIIWNTTLSTPYASGVTTDDKYVYSFSYSSEIISVLDKNTGAFVKQLTLPGYIYGYSTIVAANEFLYIGGGANGWSSLPGSWNALHKIDKTTGAYIESISTVTPTYSSAFDGETIWISAHDAQRHGYKVSEGSAYGTGGSGKNVVQLTATDPLGNTISKAFSVTVSDSIAPTITLTGNPVMNVKIGEAFTDPGAIAADNCSAKVVVTGTVDVNTIGTYVLSYKAVDGSKNESASVTRTVKVGAADDIAPIVVTKNISIALDENGNATITPAQVDGGSTDNVGIVSMTLDKTSFDCSNLGQNTVLFTVADSANNVAGTTAIVTVLDTIAPVKPMLAAITGECSANVTVIPTTFDRCAGTITGTTTDSLTYTSQGTHVITWSFNDGNGNITTASQEVIIKDVTAPAAPALADVIAECSTTVAVPTTTDNCAGIITATTSDALTYTAQGSYVINWSFNDGNGNVTTATQNVVVKDLTAPAAPALADVIAECSATVSVPTTTDNCAGSIAGTTSDALSYTAQGSYLITWRFNDGNGNVTTATQKVIVKDLTAPAALTKNISVTLVNGSATITAASIDNGSNDACGIKSLAIDKSSFNCSTVGNNTVVLTVTDNNGNVSSANAIVNVIGATPVASIIESRTDNTFTGLDSKSISLGYGAQKLTLSASNSTSGSGATTYAWSPSTGLSSTTSASPVFTPTTGGSYTFNVIATNEFGCSASASITITVIDVRGGNKGDKVLVCHKTGSKTNPWNQISIGYNAVADHLSKGGYLGACTSAPAKVASVSSSELTLTNTLNVSNTNTLSAYPNPFAGQTSVTFKLVSDQANVSLDLYDLKGVRVKNVYSGSANAQQEYSFTYDGSSIAPGVYFFKLSGSKLALTFKVIAVQ